MVCAAQLTNGPDWPLLDSICGNVAENTRKRDVDQSDVILHISLTATVPLRFYQIFWNPKSRRSMKGSLKLLWEMQKQSTVYIHGPTCRAQDTRLAAFAETFRVLADTAKFGGRLWPQFYIALWVCKERRTRLRMAIAVPSYIAREGSNMVALFLAGQFGTLAGHLGNAGNPPVGDATSPSGNPTSMGDSTSPSGNPNSVGDSDSPYLKY